MADEKSIYERWSEERLDPPSPKNGDWTKKTKLSCSGPSGPCCSWVNLILSST